jgi:hypothetical protein
MDGLGKIGHGYANLGQQKLINKHVRPSAQTALWGSCSLTFRRRERRAANGFRGGFLGWGGGALRGLFTDSAFARVDSWPAAGPLGKEDGMVGPGPGCEWLFTVFGFSSGSASEDDPYASIPGGRLADTTSGAPSSSSSELKCDLFGGAPDTLGGRGGSSVSFTVGGLNDGRV